MKWDKPYKPSAAACYLSLIELPEGRTLYEVGTWVGNVAIKGFGFTFDEANEKMHINEDKFLAKDSVPRR